ncbi:antitoxin VbhA family protein [Sporolactobacillus terrae]|uniref:antitoxin VbhA family protein n=1 Tax=Sporolactobacillus terrae TaxID=269673 RepID=UPI001CBEB5AC|nr:antitoxin VbhA family protein [Sporolactobacillus terrae]UAK18094.1 antitoxin VbhA family protein [Sporolactobacillus terrae]
MDDKLKQLYNEAVRRSEQLEKDYPSKRYKVTEKGIVLDPNDREDREWWNDDGLVDESKLEDAMKSAKHSLYLSGFTVTEEDEQDIYAVLKGKMTRDQLIEKLRQKD